MLVGLPGKTFARDAMRRLRFVDHAVGWMYSMVLHGCAAAAVLRKADKSASVLELIVSLISYLPCKNGKTLMLSGHGAVATVKSSWFQHGMCASRVKSPLKYVVEDRMTCELPCAISA